MSFLTQQQSHHAQSLYHRVSQLRGLRDSRRLQHDFREAVGRAGVTGQLLTATLSLRNTLGPLFVGDVTPSVESVGGMGAPVELRRGMDDKVVTSAAVADWLGNTADSLHDFMGTADYHLAGLQKKLEENEAKLRELGHDEVSLQRLVRAKPITTRHEEVVAVAEGLAGIGPIEYDAQDQSLQSQEEFNSMLMGVMDLLGPVAGMCREGDDHGQLGDSGLFCSETLPLRSLDAFGYTPHATLELMEITHEMIVAARAMVAQRGEYIQSLHSLRDGIFTGNSNESAAESDHLVDEENGDISFEFISTSMTCLANYVMLLTVLLDCAAHLGINIVYVSDCLVGEQ